MEGINCLNSRLKYWQQLLACIVLLLGSVLALRAAYAAAPTGTTGNSYGVPAPAQGAGDTAGQATPQFTATVSKGVISRSAAPASVLYDQYSSPAPFGESSQNFEPALNPYDDQSADDFTVPAGQSWLIDRVEVAGAYRGSGPAGSINVYFYNDASGYPGTAVITQTNLIYEPGPSAGDFVIPLSSPVSLGAGTYWVSVQANQNFYPEGQWLWRKRAVTTNNQGAWRNPGGGFYYYPNWTRCYSFGTCYYDLVYRLDGRLAGTPVTTPTGTPPTATASRTPSSPTATGTVLLPPPVLTQPVPIPTAPCGLAWRTVSSGNAGTTYHNYLFGAAVVSESDAWAVGRWDSGSPNTFQPLIERWNGTAWVMVTGLPAIQEAYLNGVTVVSANNVWAVGTYYDQTTYRSQTLTMHWNGTQWGIVPSPNAGSSYSANILNEVSAISADDVWAVGYYYDTTTYRNQTLTIHWDGTQWDIVPSPNGTGYADYQLFDVLALASDDVWAVGSGDGGYTALIIHWDGSQWSLVNNSGSGWLTSISAISANDIWAVGYTSYGYATLTLHWNGTQWSLVASPNPGSYSNYLYGVAAISPDDVWAVGFYGSTYNGQPLTMHWNGTQWSLEDDYAFGTLNDVSVVAAGDVLAVGQYYDSNTYTNQTLAQRYNDPCVTPPPSRTPTNTATGTPPTATHTRTRVPTFTRTLTPTNTPTVTNTYTSTPTPTVPPCGLMWRTVASDNVGTNYNNYLSAVAVVSQNDAWAVGRWDTGSTYQSLPLIERWNGTQWAMVNSPVPGQGVSLTGVTAVSANDVWVVGYYESSGINRTLTLHWNGSQWSIVSSPNGGTASSSNYLNGVAAVSANDVWAVGYYYDTATYQGRTLVLHWDGTQWSIVPSPNNGTTSSNILRAVSAANGAVWAVGSYFDQSTYWNRTLTMRWQSNQWSIVPSPNQGTYFDNYLYGVAVVTDTNVWAVGNYDDGYSTLILHYDGNQWSIFSSPDPGGYFKILNAVSATATDNVWAVGGYSDMYNLRTLVLRWNGQTWAIVPSPYNSTGSTGLNGVAAMSQSFVWAVGNQYDPSSYASRTLVERYNDPCANVTPTITPTRTVTRTPTPCPMTFGDVQETDYFYVPVRYLYCAGVISGYADGTFKPYNNTVRAQLSKIVVLAEGWQLLNPQQPTFSDVPTDHPFYQHIETAFDHGIITGYADGTFRPYNNVTRGQLSKIVVLAEGWPLYTPPAPTFNDVPADHPFYQHIETAFRHDIITGYADGTFKPGNSATRGQISKIVYNAVTGP